MTFFNKKEDVLEIKLTQFGKQLLSKGDFEPYYYAFFDDDIIYDNQYAGLTNETGSNQSRVEERIKENARTKTQYVYTGIETEIQRNNKFIRTGELVLNGRVAGNIGKQDPNLREFETKTERNFASYNSLANSSLNSEKLPAWNLSFYKGKVKTSSPTLSVASDYLKKRIPQIQLDLDYIISPQTVEETQAGRTEKQTTTSDNITAANRAERLENIRNDYTIDILEFPDGTSYKVAQKQIILKNRRREC
jgi:hypothetical protein